MNPPPHEISVYCPVANTVLGKSDKTNGNLTTEPSKRKCKTLGGVRRAAYKTAVSEFALAETSRSDRLWLAFRRHRNNEVLAATLENGCFTGRVFETRTLHERRKRRHVSETKKKNDKRENDESLLC